jgi:hypothetical protein
MDATATSLQKINISFFHYEGTNLVNNVPAPLEKNVPNLPFDLLLNVKCAI